VLDIIVEDVVNHGTQKVIGVIKVPNLRLLCEHPHIDLAKHMSEVRPRSSSRSRSPSKSDKSDSKKKKKKDADTDKKYPPKASMVKIISDGVASIGVQQFFEHFNADVLLDCCKDIYDLTDMKESELKELLNKKKKLLNAIITNINTFGLQYALQKFNVEELKKLCVKLDISVESNSVEVIMESIIDRKDYHRIEKKKEKPSKKAPKIEEGISKVDLNEWYTVKELNDWLKSKGCKLGGKKTDQVNRILKYLDGDRETTMPKPKRKKEEDKSDEDEHDKKKKRSDKEENSSDSKKKESNSKDDNKKDEDSKEKKKKNSD